MSTRSAHTVAGGGNRLPAPAGLLPDRQQPLRFHFEGREYTGLGGDTIASALAANDVWVLSRSFKYHRPRGAMSFADLEGDTLVQVGDEPNVPADCEPLRAGMRVQAQNCLGGVRRDWLAPMGYLSRFMPVGFYYKSLYRPRGVWQRLWEPLIRRAAGLGRVRPDPDAAIPSYDKEYRFCDVAVIGGGPAGMAAALAAAAEGAEVLLIEREPVLGGSLNYLRPAGGAATEAAAARARRIGEVERQERIETMTDTLCNAWYADHWLAAIRGRCLYKIRARQVVLATGTMEQPALFRNNDLPGILLGTAAQRLIRLYGVRPGRRAVVLSADDSGYAVAQDLLEAGTEVAAVVDLRTEAATTQAERLRQAGIPLIPGSTVYAAGCRFRMRAAPHLAGVELAHVRGDGRPDSCHPAGIRIDCDLLCVCGGRMPAYPLALQAGGRLIEAGPAFAIDDLPPGLHLAGAVNGIMDAGGGAAPEGAAARDGEAAGRRAAAGRANATAPAQGAAHRGRGLNPGTAGEVGPQADPKPSSQPWPLCRHPRGKEFVDRDEDLQYADIINACADGYAESELVKRYSTVGMGPSQGRHSALAAASLIAAATGRTPGEVGVTTGRPPLSGEKLGVLAGRRFLPVRHTAMHARHLESGARMMLAGPWLRPAWYGPGREQGIRQEALAVRRNVGMIDVSTLGGIEIRGPEAVEFMNRIYTFGYAKQKVGRTRYVLMTNLAGNIIDDGISCRLHDEHFYVTATTGGADNVYRSMLWWNAQWRLDVSVVNATAAWAGISLSGPRSREVLSPLCTDIDLSPQGFPYLGVRTGTVGGIPARVLRVGFVGELGYEIHVPSSMGEALWDALLEAGRELDIRPVGIEAQRILRLEKGHLIVGQDTDAMATPAEAGMGWAIARRKPFSSAAAPLEIRDREPRRLLVAFRMDSAETRCPQESDLVLDGAEIAGHVTSVVHSPTLGYVIGLAWTPPHTRPGDTLRIRPVSGDIMEAEVVQPPFYDPENKRQEM